MLGFCRDCGDYTVLDTDDHCSECGSHRITHAEKEYLCKGCGAFTIPDETNRCVSCGSPRIKLAAATRRDNFNIEPLPKNQSEEDVPPEEIATWPSIEEKQTGSPNVRTNVEIPSEAVHATRDQDGVKNWEFQFAWVVMFITLLGLGLGIFLYFMQLLGLK